jgi:bile acid:Na+ symporter, BASS family
MAIKLAAAITLIALTFGAGLQVNREHLIGVLKDTVLLAKAFLANFVIVPLLGVLFVYLFRLPPYIATGFLLMAIAPGVPFVLSSVRKRGGRLGLAVALEVFLPLLSIVTVPITAALVLPAGAQGHLPLAKFFLTLVLFQLLPLLLGIMVGGRAPAAAPQLARVSHIIFLVALVTLLALLGPKLVHGVALVYGSGGILAMICLVVLSLAIGWALGGPAREDRRVLGIGTALRNIGLCALIASTSFTEPIVVASVATYLIVQVVIVTIVGIFFTRTAQRVAA